MVKDSVAELNFSRMAGAEKVRKIPWSAGPPTPVAPVPSDPLTDFLWVLGGSASKRAYVPTLLAAWKPTYPNLYITTVEPLDLSGVTVPPNILVHVGDISAEERH